jgi:hypothetical protein
MHSLGPTLRYEQPEIVLGPAGSQRMAERITPACFPMLRMHRFEFEIGCQPAHVLSLTRSVSSCLTAERLDVIPAQFRVIVTHRPKYACRVTVRTGKSSSAVRS